MRTVLTLAVAAILLASPLQAQNDVAETADHSYGAGVTMTAAPESLASAIERELVDKPLVVKAEVVDVCSAKGCWLVLKDGEAEVRVRFKDYGFFVPSSLKGRTVLVQGVLAQEVISEADRRHYAEDAGASDEEILQIVGDMKEFTFEATGVKGE